jgi:hypothetical protein
MLAFYIGNDVQSEAAQCLRWCPVSGEYGRTQCGIIAITAAYTWGGLSRRKLTMGTQRAGRRKSIMRDPRESTLRRILSLLSRRNGDRTSLMAARLTTTPWSRKKQAMVKKDQLQASPGVSEDESAPVGRPRAEQSGEEPLVASRKSHSEPRFFRVDWPRKWEMSLGRATTNEHQSPGPLREMRAAWLREQGDWDGSKAISEDWVLLEGRACEIARAEAQLDLQQAHEKGTVNDYLQSLRKRGHVGLANVGLTILNA